MRRLLQWMGGLYAFAVVAFCTAGVFHDRPAWADATRAAAHDVRVAVVAWTSDTAISVKNSVVAWLDANDKAPPVLRGSQDTDQPAQPTRVAKPAAPRVAPVQAQPVPVETQVAEAAPSPPLEPVEVTPKHRMPEVQVAEAVPPPPPAPPRVVAPAPTPRVAEAAPGPAPRVAEIGSPSRAQIVRVRDRLRVSLPKELLQNFDLFLYVSKADHGPWAQHMFVFAKEGDDNLRSLHVWPVSTGREASERDPHGRMHSTATPPGYYQLDPGRMMRTHTSGQWDQPMPFAMFFNWIRKGMATGLAIHGVEGDEVALLGRRASAGCVRLSPDRAELLFNLVRENYRGEVPRFATDHRKYSTMSNQGELMRNGDGDLVFARGYRVLVYIDGYGGEELVSALF